ncbi:MAG: YbaN family protein [Alkalimonas sp.]|nr:YbaN family protein [Alkalimonas sp.]
MMWLRVLCWRVLAIIALLLGLLGIPLPGLPTVPFVLLSAWAAGKGWPALELWLLQHPRYGPPIIAWRQHGAVSRRAKWLASVMMTGSVVLMWYSAAPALLKVILPLFLAGVASWLWLRPEPVPVMIEDKAND